MTILTSRLPKPVSIVFQVDVTKLDEVLAELDLLNSDLQTQVRHGANTYHELAASKTEINTLKEHLVTATKVNDALLEENVRLSQKLAALNTAPVITWPKPAVLQGLNLRQDSLGILS